jgi:acyl-CoA synthetase (AMP-forming)/AMP-acid ligase II
LVNLYGPTEATIACTEHVFDPQVEEGSYRAEVVPIGLPFPGLQVTLGEGNELLVGGPQIAPGYWQDPDLTGQKFLALPGSSEPWYRTGDVVERDDDGTLHFLGRVDSQLKIRGHRVELQEVESVLRKAVGHDLVLVVPFPVTEAGVEGLIACVESQGGQASDRSEEVLEFCRQLLAPYMVPSRVAWFDALPRNSNGKLDRIGCRCLIEQGA